MTGLERVAGTPDLWPAFVSRARIALLANLLFILEKTFLDRDSITRSDRGVEINFAVFN